LSSRRAVEAASLEALEEGPRCQPAQDLAGRLARGAHLRQRRVEERRHVDRGERLEDW